MPKCERCGLNGYSLELKMCPDIIPDWGNKPICKQCYIELKKLNENNFLKNNNTSHNSSEEILINKFGNNNYERSAFIEILAALWIIIGFLFICIAFQRTSDYLDLTGGIIRSGEGYFLSEMLFHWAFFTIIFILIIILSFLLAYGSLMKKTRSWLIGIMLSSFLTYFGLYGILILGLTVISEDYGDALLNLEFYASILISL
ncbi:hypothetical protein AYK21_01580 [Thermoplasmatales archaeon SG8-52-2]|nr:MAG: hypothetical protein AYK21_01580 [Thermoplasmatales archaeon SG8-52-2]